MAFEGALTDARMVRERGRARLQFRAPLSVAKRAWSACGPGSEIAHVGVLESGRLLQPVAEQPIKPHMGGQKKTRRDEAG